MSSNQTMRARPQLRERYYTRFSRSQRIQHLVMMVSFTALGVTGIPQKFSDQGWAQAVISLMGGIDTVRFIHHYVFAAMFVGVALYHIPAVLYEMFRRRVYPSLVPTFKDARDAVQMLAYSLGFAQRPPAFDRFDYRQKFEYWGLVFGSFLMIATGIILLYPTWVARVLPGVLIPASRVAHSNEGLLAVMLIVTWHLYSAHLCPEHFPIDTSIFTGKVSEEKMMEEHPLEYARLTGTTLHDPEDGVTEPPVMKENLPPAS